MSLTASTFLKTVIIDITSRKITLIGDDDTSKVIEFQSVDAFVARRQFIEENRVGFQIEYVASVE